MRFSFLPVVVFVGAISCVTYQRMNPEELAGAAPSDTVSVAEDDIEMERERVESPRVPADIQPLTLDQILSQSADGLNGSPESAKLLEEGKKFLSERRKFGQTGAFKKKCQEDPEHTFCVAYKFHQNSFESRGSKGIKKPKAPVKTVQKHLKAKDIEKLKEINFSSILSAAKKLKHEEVVEVAQKVTENTSCLSEDLYVALGSVLEYEFPDEASVNLNNQLLEKSQKCFSSDFTARSNFRLGMFKVWRNQCEQAIPLFDLALNNQSLKGLHPRSTYWKDWCKTKKKDSAETPAIANEFYKNFPESFHALLADDGPTPMAYNLLAANVDPKVQFRSKNNKELNAYLDVLDMFIRLGEEQIAFSLVENLKPDQYQNEEPEVLLYLSIICNRVQAGLVKFQIMGRMFDKNPSYKTVKTMKLYYPSWYMDTVLQYKDKVNPYLIMALIRQESAFNKRAHSVADARGLMQLLPGTARSFGRVKKHELFTPEKNIASGVRFFSHLMERYNNQVPLALAAYNAGPLNVDDWVKRYPTDNPLLFIDIIPFKETREYVSSILRNWYWYNKLYAETYPAQSNKNDPLARAISSASAP